MKKKILIFITMVLMSYTVYGDGEYIRTSNSPFNVTMIDIATNNLTTNSWNEVSVTNNIASHNSLIDFYLKRASECLDNRQLSAAIDLVIFAIKELQKEQQILKKGI